MGNDFLSAVLAVMLMITPAVVAVLEFVMGVLTVSGRQKSTKWLGIAYIIQSIATIVYFLTRFIMRFVSIELIASFSMAGNIVITVCAFISMVFICVFIHKNYGKKLIYVPVLLLQFASFVIPTAAMYIVNNLHVFKGNKLSAALTLISGIGNFVPVAIATVIIIVVLFKNRQMEKTVQFLWVFELIYLIILFFVQSADAVYYLNVLSEGNYNAMKGLGLEYVEYGTMLCVLIESIYVMVKSRKKEALSESSVNQ